MKTIVVNKSKSCYDVYIGRPSKWGNPFSVKEYGRGVCVEMHKQWIKEQILSGKITKKDFEELRGKRLGCYCKPNACHGDILAKITNQLFENNLIEFMK
ncbi:MAG: hypothetical protein [Caudoviricetes sp.]|nr:MAG: hypothetical protein [Caudoviricetes sp.]